MAASEEFQAVPDNNTPLLWLYFNIAGVIATEFVVYGVLLILKKYNWVDNNVIAYLMLALGGLAAWVTVAGWSADAKESLVFIVLSYGGLAMMFGFTVAALSRWRQIKRKIPVRDLDLEAVANRIEDGIDRAARQVVDGAHQDARQIVDGMERLGDRIDAARDPTAHPSGSQQEAPIRKKKVFTKPGGGAFIKLKKSASATNPILRTTVRNIGSEPRR